MSTFAHGRGIGGTDHRPSEVLGAAFIAGSVVVWIVILLKMSNLAGVAEETSGVEKGAAIPIRITPVMDMDSPLLKLGGKAKFPKEWKVAPPPKATEKTSAASTQAKDDERDIPEGGLPVHEGSSAPNVDPDGGPPSDASGDEPGDGSPGDAGEGSGGGSAEGSKDGTVTDGGVPRWKRDYHGRILAFLKRGFRCPSLPEGAKRCTPYGTVSIGGDLTVTSVAFSGCGVAEIDAAASATLMSKKGQQIPPPPGNHPNSQPPTASIQFVCK